MILKCNGLNPLIDLINKAYDNKNEKQYIIKCGTWVNLFKIKY